MKPKAIWVTSQGMMKGARPLARRTGRKWSRDALGFIGLQPASKMREYRWLALGIGVGALAMFMFDPRMGRRRRALAHDQVTHFKHEAQDTAEGKAEDLSNRARGLASGVRGKSKEMTEQYAQAQQQGQSRPGQGREQQAQMNRPHAQTQYGATGREQGQSQYQTAQGRAQQAGTAHEYGETQFGERTREQEQRGEKGIAREEWAQFCKNFTQQHEGWLVTIEQEDPKGQNQTVLRDEPLQELSYQEDHGGIDLRFVVGKQDINSIAHVVDKVESMRLQYGPGDADQALNIRSADGTTVVRFRSPLLP